jgi:hypothetical protein
MSEGAYGMAKGMWDPATPRNAWPRKIKASIIGGVLGVYGQPLIGMAAWDRRELVPGQINVAAAGSWANVSDLQTAYSRNTRAAPVAATEDYVRWGQQSIHGYLDPAGPALGQALIAQDYFYTDPAVGVSWYAFGWGVCNTAADSTSFSGIAWVADPTTGHWLAVVNEGTGTPSTSLHLYDSGKERIAQARLGIVLDGTSHTVGFYDNVNLVSTWTPTVVPAQFGAGAYFGYFQITAAGATSRFNIFGGGNPRLLSIVEA